MIAAIVIWISAGICLVAALSATLSWRKTMRSVRRMQALYSSEAPPVPLVEVRLKTGEIVHVQPIEPHRQYVWKVPMPAAPNEIDEIVIPELPPWTQLTPWPVELSND